VLPPVTSNVTYSGIYTQIIKTYIIQFVDRDDTELKAATEYTVGTPAASIDKPADPTRDPDD
jgi:hypothetical protein